MATQDKAKPAATNQVPMDISDESKGIRGTYDPKADTLTIIIDRVSSDEFGKASAKTFVKRNLNINIPGINSRFGGNLLRPLMHDEPNNAGGMGPVKS